MLLPDGSEFDALCWAYTGIVFALGAASGVVLIWLAQYIHITLG